MLKNEKLKSLSGIEYWFVYLCESRNELTIMDINGAKRNFEEYYYWTEALVTEGKTSGANQSDALIGFTALNLRRMKRIVKTNQLKQELLDLLKVAEPSKWVVITEAWCGDSAQNLPVIGQMVGASNGNIDLEIIGRDDNPQWMEKYHTNGSKSIPKLIAFDQNDNEIFTWGPRPAQAQKLLKDWKENPNGRSWEDFETELHTWYAKDKYQSIQEEFIAIFKEINQTNYQKV